MSDLFQIICSFFFVIGINVLLLSTSNSTQSGKLAIVSGSSNCTRRPRQRSQSRRNDTAMKCHPRSRASSRTTTYISYVVTKLSIGFEALAEHFNLVQTRRSENKSAARPVGCQGNQYCLSYFLSFRPVG
jgi:hypothetical protein